MGRRHIITINKQVRCRITTTAISIVVVLSCATDQHKERNGVLLNNVPIQEKEGNVLHQIPLSVQLLSDSLAGIRLNAVCFNVYNYYTGRIVRTIVPDTNILPELLRLADPAGRYRIMSVQEGKEAGVPVLSVENIFYRKQDRQFDVYITASFCSDTLIMINGVKEKAVMSHPLYYVFTVDENYRRTSKYALLDCGNTGPAFLFGGLQLKDILLVPNVELEHIDMPGFGMLCGIGLGPDCGKVRSIAVPFDKRSMAQRKSHILEKMSFAGTNGGDYYVSDGSRIIYCKDSVFRDYYTMPDQEHIYNLYYNETRKQLYINTRFGDQADLKGSKVFSLDIPAKKLKLIDSSGKVSSVDFINDSTILSITEKKATGSYAFSVYQY